MTTKLEDLIPEKPEFTLRSNGKTYVVRPPNLQDNVFFKAKFGDEKAIEKLFADMDWSRLVQIIYRLMVDKSDFTSSVENIINDDGDRVEVKVLGHEKLLAAIGNGEEAVEVFRALIKAFVLANPLIEEDIKKSMEPTKKKVMTDKSKPIGDTSSTRSQASTVTQ